MNNIKRANKKHFYDYYEQGDDTKRLTLILLLFAFFLCPFFAFLFKFLGAPVAYFYAILSATFIFPIILFLERMIPYFKNKLPYLYFLFFNGITIYVIYELYLVHFRNFDFAFFIGLFALLNFAVQRFYLSLIYFFNTLVFLFIAAINIPNKEEINFYPIFTLVCCIGVFYAVVYYSRNKMINVVQDHNKYLKRIVNNLGNGIVFFQLRGNFISLVDYNLETINILNYTEVQEIEALLSKNIDPDDIFELNELQEEQYKIKEIEFQEKIIEFKITKIILNNGDYFLATIQDVTTKIEENKIIKKNEKKYKNLFVRNQSALFTLEINGNILECNPAFLKLFELDDNEEIHLFTDLEWLDLKEIIQKKGIFTNYNKVYDEDTDKPKYLVFNFYFDYENKVIEGNILDITEITLRTKALRENENKYRVIYEESNDSIVLLDEDRIIDINQQGIKLLGKKQADILEKSLWDFTYNQNPALKKEYDKLIENLRQKKQAKFNWVFAKGKEFIDVSISIVELNLGDELLYQCVIRDETERNSNILALENSKKTFESIIENTPEGFLILKGKECVFASQEFFRIFNLETKAASDISLDESFFGLNFPKFEKLLEEHAEDKEIKQKQLKFFIDNKSVEIDTTIVSIIFEEEEATLLILKDVSFQNKLSKEVLRAELAEETNKRLEKEIDERQKAEQKLASEYLRTNAIFDSSENTLLFTLDTNLEVTSFNRHFKNYFDYQTRKDLNIGIPIEKYFEQILSPIKLRYFRYLISSLRKGKSHQLELKFINVYNEKKWMEVFLNPIFDLNGNLSEISLVSHDITFKKNYEKEILTSLKEKEVLLKEVHHRVKNNLQIISSILNLQSSYVEDEKILEIIEESRHRIRSMAIIHENLYQTTNFSSINFKNYSRELVRNLISSYQFNKDLEVDLIEKVELVELNLDQAIPCGLIINEIITNSMKYAFPNRKKGKIYLELKEKNTNITLVVGDDGIGLPKEFNVKEAETLGLQLVMTLVEQLDGNIKIETSKGIKYFITFEKQKL